MRVSKRLKIALLVIGSALLLALAWIAVTFGRAGIRLGYVDSAIGSLRVIVNAENKFADAHPDVGYACTFPQLLPDDLIAGLVKDGHRNGYAIEISGCTPSAKNAKYSVTARPLYGNLPAFCTDQSGIVRRDDAGSVQGCLKHGLPL